MLDVVRLIFGLPTPFAPAPWQSPLDTTKFGAEVLRACTAWTTPDFAWVPEAEDGPLAVSVFGSADAFGVDTFASTEVSVTMIARGMVSLAFGTASFVACATSPLGESAFALATSGVSADADFLFTLTETASGSGEARGESWWYEASRTTFFAFDVMGLEPRGGAIELAAATSKTVSSPLNINGNLAEFSVESVVLGDHAHNEVNVQALAIEDALSSVLVVAEAGTADDPWGVEHLFVRGSAKGDRIVAGAGDDWAFGLAGNDTIQLGEGDNAAFGGAGNDKMSAGAGDDWLFGGLGNDLLELGDGTNIGFGGAGNDTIRGGAGDDAIYAGPGSDIVDAGGGNNTFLLGACGLLGDGNDRFVAGDGADWYLLAGSPFGRDTIQGFSVGQGDRLIAFSGGDWDSEAGLRGLNGSAVFLSCAPADADDLIVTFDTWLLSSVLVLDDFFRLNPEYAAVPRRGVLDDTQALPILRDIFVDGDTDPEIAVRTEPFRLGDLLDVLG